MALEQAPARAAAVSRAANVVGTIRTIYDHIQRLEQARALYVAGTDATFNSAFNALFDVTERAEISAMITQLKGIADDWEVNHLWATS